MACLPFLFYKIQFFLSFTFVFISPLRLEKYHGSGIWKREHMAGKERGSSSFLCQIYQVITKLLLLAEQGGC